MKEQPKTKPPAAPDPDCWRLFLERLAGLDSPRVLEIGTRGWDGRPPRHHREEVLGAHPGASWLGVDFLDGPGVDAVCDAHKLSGRFPAAHFDAAVLDNVLEHCARPWLVGDELAKVVKPGGWIYVQAPQTFPVHHYPGDYWRFTTDALRELFAPDRGWWPVATRSIHPARVLPLQNGPPGWEWNFEAPAWLESEILARRS